MFICLDQRTGTGCGAENNNTAQHCRRCGRSLHFALQLHDPGTLIDSYRVVRILGRGSFGAVYEAEDIRRGMVRVALKETVDPASIRSFQHEFAVLHGLQHPNLPSYHTVFEAQGNAYLVMEYIPGQNLEEVLQQQRGPLIESQVLGYTIQLCDALAYLHRQTPPILHRDIKPANIRLTPAGLIKLVDFGLLKQGLGTTKSMHMGLTPAYAPIEQYGGAGQHSDARSDLFSLGATLYHLLTAQEPTPVPLRLSTTPDPLIPAQQHNPLLSAPISDALIQAMSLMQKDRFASAEEMKHALLGQRASATRPAPPAPQPLLPTAVVPPARASGTGAWPSWWAIVLVGMLLVVGMLGFALNRQAPAAPASSAEHVSATTSASQAFTALPSPDHTGATAQAQLADAKHSTEIAQGQQQTANAQATTAAQVAGTSIAVAQAATAQVVAGAQTAMARTTTAQAAIDATAIAAVLPAPTAQPIRSSSSMFTVQAAEGWQDTGVAFEVNDTITIEYIDGTWTSTPGTTPFSDGNGPPSHYSCAPTLPAERCVEPIPDFPQGALIGKIATQLLKVGNNLTFTVKQAGALYLRMNDGDAGLHDNAGALNVKITVRAPL